EAKNKIFIGCNVSRKDPNLPPTLDEDGDLVWENADREIGTVTLVVDYPSLQNPKIITSTRSKANNHAYRTMSQYVGNDGHIYTAGTDICCYKLLRTSTSTNYYVASFFFNFRTALGDNSALIQAWRYIENGNGIVLYSKGSNSGGGYIALIDLNAGTAKAI